MRSLFFNQKLFKGLGGAEKIGYANAFQLLLVFLGITDFYKLISINILDPF